MAWNLGAIVTRFRLDTTDWKRGKREVQADVAALGAEMVGLGVAITGVGVAAVREFGLYDRALREALAVSDVTAEQFQQMSDMAEDAAVALNKSAVETVKGFYYLGSAGLSATKQMAAFTDTAKMARAATVSVGDAAEGLVDITSAFDLAFADAADTTDILTKSVISANHMFHQLRTAMKYIAPVAEATNNSLIDTATVLGLMADSGIKGSKAGTAMRFALTALTNPAGELRGMLRNMGLEIYDTTGKMKPFIQILEEVTVALQGSSEQYRNMVFETMMGKRALPGMLALYKKGTENIRDYRKEIQAFAGTVDMVVKKQMAALLHQIGRIARATARIVRSLGETLAPAIRGVVAEVMPLLEATEDWIHDNIALVTTIVKTTAAVGLLSIAAGSLLMGLAGFKLILPFLIGQFTLISTLLMSWVIPLAVAVTGFYALRVAWSDSLTKMREVADDFGDKFVTFLDDLDISWTDIFNVMGSTFVKFFNRIMTGYGKIGALVAIVLKAATSFWRDLSEEERQYVKGLEDFIKDPTIINFWEPLKAGALELSAGMKELVEQDLEALRAKLTEIAPNLVGFIDGIRAALSTGITPDLPGVPGAGGDGEPAADSITDAPNKYMKMWKLATKSVVQDFDTMSDLIVNNMDNLVNDWEDAFSNFMQLSGNFGDKFKALMEDIFNAVYQSFVDTLARMAAQRMFWQLFGAGVLPSEAKAGWIPGMGAAPTTTGGDMGMTQPSYQGEYAGVSKKIAININNSTGSPIDLEVDSVTTTREALVLDATMKLAETNTVFRRTFVNEEQ